MRRFGLRDDQWERIKNLLPGRDGSVGVTAADHCACPSAQRRRAKKADEDQAIGHSRGGLSTKIHALVDALGNPIGFFLTGGEAHDLVGLTTCCPRWKPTR